MISLADKSLVIVEFRETGSRFRMLETIRDYANAKLVNAEEAPAAFSRHCQHFRKLARTARLALTGPQQGEWMRRLEADHDNVRAAIDRALSGIVDPVDAVKLQVALQSFWILGGHSAEALGYARRALALSAVRTSNVALGHALYVAGALATEQGLHAEAAAFLEECLALRRQFAQPVDIAATLSTLGWLRLSVGDLERARVEESEALHLFRSLGDRVGEAIGLLHLGQIAIAAKQHVEAGENVEAALAIAGEIAHREVETEAERTLGQLALDQGDVAAAHARFDRALQISRGAGDKRNEAIATWWAGKADLEAKKMSQAAMRFAVALHAFRSFEMNAELLDCLDDCAALAHARGLAVQAVEIAGTGSRAREHRLLSRPAVREHRWQERLAALPQALGDDAFQAAWSRGREVSLEAAIREGTAWTG